MRGHIKYACPALVTSTASINQGVAMNFALLKSKLALSALLIFSLVSIAVGQETKDARTEQVDKIFAGWDKNDSPGCALAIIKDGRIIYKRGYGMAHLEQNSPITSTT